MLEAVLIELAPGAERNELARLLADRVRDHIATRRGRAAFEATHAAMAVIPDEVGAALTLRFDFGHLTVHPGFFGRPELTISGSRQDIERLLGLPLGGARASVLGAVVRSRNRRALLQVGRALRTRRLRIYGLLTHPQLLLRLLGLISRAA